MTNAEKLVRDILGDNGVAILEREVSQRRRIEQQATEIAALRGAIRWLDLHRGELPSSMNPGTYAAYIRAMEEER